MASAKFKVVVLGDSSVGKSCFLMRYVSNSFTMNHISTIGVDVRKKLIMTSKGQILLQIWDTAGQEKFRGLASSYLRNTDGVILIYDISCRESFEHVTEWIETIQTTAQKNYKMVLVGNKSDLEDQRAVFLKEANDLALSHNVRLIEASAKTGVGVEETFNHLTERMVTELDGNQDDDGKIILGNSNQKTRSCCYVSIYK